jgi:hypothetical protein
MAFKVFDATGNARVLQTSDPLSSVIARKCAPANIGGYNGAVMCVVHPCDDPAKDLDAATRKANAQIEVWDVWTQLLNDRQSDSGLDALVDRLKNALEALVSNHSDFELSDVILHVCSADDEDDIVHVLGGVLSDNMYPFSERVLRVVVDVLEMSRGVNFLSTLFKHLAESFGWCEEMMRIRLFEGYSELPDIVTSLVKIVLDLGGENLLQMMFRASDETGFLIGQSAFNALDKLKSVDRRSDSRKRKRDLKDLVCANKALSVYTRIQLEELEREEREERG